MPPSGIITPAFSLMSAASWGAADFSGGIAAKRSDVFGIVVVAHSAGLVLMLGMALLVHDPFPSLASFGWGVLAGLCGAVGLASLYRALAVGKMGIAAPIAAVVTAVLPVVVGFATEGFPHLLRLVGFAAGAISIWLIAMPAEGLERPKGVGLALLAGMGFGGFLVFSKQAGAVAVFWPLVAARVASVGLISAFVLSSRNRHLPARGGFLYAIVAGVLDSTGNALFVAASQHGRLDVAAVLSSFYPVSTVVLARIFLKEKLSTLQTAGMALALASVPLIVM
ncbi:MAG: DMT family transporter [Acidobacteriaceae bacterium]|nr:DMT family transporter [Acidobacteriaceae bacterium]